MKSFEERLERLETISTQMKEQGLSLSDSLALFEEGMGLSKELEKELETIEQKVQILVSSSDQASPVFESFDEVVE